MNRTATGKASLIGVLITALVLVIAACEGGSAFTTTTAAPTITAASTTSEAPTTTAPTTTAAPATTEAPPDTTEPPPDTTAAPPDFPFDVHPVAATELCVIGLGFGGTFNVREGPSTDYAVVGTLPYGRTGVQTLGWGALDDDGDEWKQIMFEGEERWAAAWFMTPDTCTVGTPTTYCVVDTACNDGLNIRNGVSVDYPIIGEFPASAADVAGTGVVALDDQGREWVQVEWFGNIGWSAGWFLDAEPCSATFCAVADWVWRTTRLGPVVLGMTVDEASVVAGPYNTIDSLGGPPGVGCFWATWDDFSVLGHDFVIESIYSGAGVNHSTAAGITIGSTEAEVLAAYPSATIETGGYGERIISVGSWSTWYESGLRFFIQAGAVTYIENGRYFAEGCA